MADNPMRSVVAMRAAPRCGARTRDGDPCQGPAVRGRRRCRMHGGAPGSGAPLGNRNALVHGMRSRAAIEERKRVNALLRACKKLLGEIS